MNWNEVPTMLAELYGAVSAWCFNHQVETDVMIVVTVLGICAYILKGQRHRRRIRNRLLRGMYMLTRKEQKRLQQTRFEDAIVDIAMEMVSRGEMTEQQEAEWYKYFYEQCKLKGLQPTRTLSSVKRAVEKRLTWKNLYGLLPVKIPGGPPGTKADPTYDGRSEGLARSKYSNSN